MEIPIAGSAATAVDYKSRLGALVAHLSAHSPSPRSDESKSVFPYHKRQPPSQKSSQDQSRLQASGAEQEI